MCFSTFSYWVFLRFVDASIKFTWTFFRLPVNPFRVLKISHIMVPVPGPTSTKFIVCKLFGTICY